MRIAFFTNIISPYRIAFLNHLARHPCSELRVFYLAEQEPGRSWKTYFHSMEYPYEVLPGMHVPLQGRTLHLNYGVLRSLRRYRPSVIVTGIDILSSPVSWLLLLYARMRKIPLIRFEGQHRYSASNSKLKGAMYTIYYLCVDAFFVYSHLTHKYLCSLGVPRSRITVGFNVGDTEYIQRAVDDYRSRASFPIERRKYPSVMFLFVGRLSHSKGILSLLDVLKTLDLDDAGLFIVGDGGLRDEVVRMTDACGRFKIFYEGFKEKEDLIRYLALADVFVLPTLCDRASIVLSEALVSGLFCIASIYDGSTHNFIVQDRNGFVIDPRERTILERAIIDAYRLKKDGKLNRTSVTASMNAHSVANYAARLSRLITLCTTRSLPGDSSGGSSNMGAPNSSSDTG